MTCLSKEQEKLAKKEYLSIIDTLLVDFPNEFKGHWEDKEVINFLNKKTIVIGDKKKFLKNFTKNLNL